MPQAPVCLWASEESHGKNKWVFFLYWLCSSSCLSVFNECQPRVTVKFGLRMIMYPFWNLPPVKPLHLISLDFSRKKKKAPLPPCVLSWLLFSLLFKSLLCHPFLLPLPSVTNLPDADLASPSSSFLVGHRVLLSPGPVDSMWLILEISFLISSSQLPIC